MKRYFSILFLFLGYYAFSQAPMPVIDVDTPFVLANLVEQGLHTYESLMQITQQTAYMYEQLQQTYNNLQNMKFNDWSSIRDSAETVSKAYFDTNNDVRNYLGSELNVLGTSIPLYDLPNFLQYSYKIGADSHGLEYSANKVGLNYTASLVEDLTRSQRDTSKYWSLYTNNMNKSHEDYIKKKQALESNLLSSEPSAVKTSQQILFTLDSMYQMLFDHANILADQNRLLAKQSEEQKKQENQVLEEQAIDAEKKENASESMNVLKPTTVPQGNNEFVSDNFVLPE